MGKRWSMMERLRKLKADYGDEFLKKNEKFSKKWRILTKNGHFRPFLTDFREKIRQKTPFLTTFLKILQNLAKFLWLKWPFLTTFLDKKKRFLKKSQIGSDQIRIGSGKIFDRIGEI